MSGAELAVLLQWGIAIGPFATGIWVAFIAYQQWRTAQAKLRFDLFEKRLKIYLAVRSIIQSARIYGQITAIEVEELKRTLEGAEFLFDAEIKNYFSAIRDMALNAAIARSRSGRHGDTDLRRELVEEEETMLKYIREQGDLLDHTFRKAMDLSRI